MARGWIKVDEAKPKCPRGADAFGTPVLIWPRKPSPHDMKGTRVDGFAYYGRRATGRPAFYLYGAEFHGVTHWMPMPEGPKK